MRPIYVTPCKDLQGAAVHSAATARNTWKTRFFYVHCTTHGTYDFTSHLKDEAVIIKCLALGHKCQDWDLNPHSADQKHQSLSPVYLSARPRHAKKCW